MEKIHDKFSNLPVSRQRKHQLRHPEKAKLLSRTWRQSPKGLMANRANSRHYYHTHINKIFKNCSKCTDSEK